MAAAGSAARPLRDRVAAYVTTTGTGATVTLGAAVPKYRLPLAADSGATVPFVIEDGVAWEKGTAVLALSGSTWTAALTLDESYNADGSANGALLSLSGSAQLFVDARAVDIAYAADIASEIASRQALELQVAYQAFVAAYTTATSDLAGVRDDYQDSSGIDTTNSSGLAISAGDVSNQLTIYAPTNLTSDAGSGGFSVFASSESSSAHAAFRAFDGDNTSSWSPTNTTAGQYIGLALPSPATFISGATTSSGALPAGVVEGSTTQTGTYATVASVDNNGLVTANGSTAAYSFFRWRNTAPAAGQQQIQIATFSATFSAGPQAATLRRTPLNYTSARKRAYVFHLLDMASGVQLNTDLVGSVGDGTTWIQGTYKVVGAIGAHSVIALFGGDGNMGVDVSALATTKLVTRDVMTATGRIDVRATVAKAA